MQIPYILEVHHLLEALQRLPLWFKKGVPHSGNCLITNKEIVYFDGSTIYTCGLDPKTFTRSGKPVQLEFVIPDLKQFINFLNTYSQKVGVVLTKTGESSMLNVTLKEVKSTTKGFCVNGLVPPEGFPTLENYGIVGVDSTKFSELSLPRMPDSKLYFFIKYGDLWYIACREKTLYISEGLELPIRDLEYFTIPSSLYKTILDSKESVSFYQEGDTLCFSFSDELYGWYVRRDDTGIEKEYSVVCDTIERLEDFSFIDISEMSPIFSRLRAIYGGTERVVKLSLKRDDKVFRLEVSCDQGSDNRVVTIPEGSPTWEATYDLDSLTGANYATEMATVSHQNRDYTSTTMYLRSPSGIMVVQPKAVSSSLDSLEEEEEDF